MGSMSDLVAFRQSLSDDHPHPCPSSPATGQQLPGPMTLHILTPPSIPLGPEASSNSSTAATPPNEPPGGNQAQPATHILTIEYHSAGGSLSGCSAPAAFGSSI